ncbi:MAG TPA: ABC transporter permease [Candidatus Acidoferrales bacterium]|nr:ABC transporter permease [Candidatus Acidoferrales bacterium]
MDSFSSQLKQVFRRLRRAPMFTFITLFTLAAGIGANTAVFSVLEGILLKPLPYPHPEQLVGVWHNASGLNIAELNMAPSNYFVYRDQSRTFQDIGIYQNDSVSVTGVAEPEQVRALDVTDGTLPILGVSPVLGRLFTRQDDSPSATKTALLTYGYWQSKFGAAPSAIGRTILVDGTARQIIGVLPRKFHFLDQPDPALILPLRLDRGKTFLGQFSYEGLARLKPGTTLAEANADVARMLPIVLRSFPSPPGFSLELFKKARIGPNVRPLKQDVVGDVGNLLWVLMGGISMVLLIACANVANLLLVRTEGRQQELAIRAALGASHTRIAVELLFESLVIGLMGSILGLGVAYSALRLLVAMAPTGLPRLGEIGIDGPVLLFTLVIAMFTSLLFGLVPVFKYARAHAATGLREGGRTLSQGRERHRARNVLVTVQVALAFVLLICSGLMIRTFRALSEVNPGFVRPAQVQTFGLDIPDSQAASPELVLRMEQQISQKLAVIPGVSSVGFSNSLPMDGNGWHDPVFAQDRTYAQGELPALRTFEFMSPEYLQTMGIPLIAGRNLTWTDTYNKIPVALVSENFAREYWHNPANALGKRIRVSTKDDWREIIGVVGDVRNDGINQPAPTSVYWPILTANFESEPLRVRRDVAFAMRTPRAGSQTFMNEVRQAVWSVNANLPLANPHTLDYYYQRSMARTSFTLVMLGIAGAMALLLGSVGLYGVIAYSVSQRTREIGIRMALGATLENVRKMVVMQGMRLASVGVIVGIAAALALTRLMAGLVYGVKTWDPLVFISVAMLLSAVSWFAAYVPARRASRVDPMVSLRYE